MTWQNGCLGRFAIVLRDRGGAERRDDGLFLADSTLKWLQESKVVPKTSQRGALHG